MGDSGSFTELVVHLVGFGKRIEGRTLRANTHEQVASPALAIAVAHTLDFGEESAKFDIEGSKAYCLSYPHSPLPRRELLPHFSCEREDQRDSEIEKCMRAFAKSWQDGIARTLTTNVAQL